MGKLTRQQDAFGRCLYDHLAGNTCGAAIERDDGFVDLLYNPAGYFSEHKAWPSHQRKALRLARGRVLDVGCGAGRVALHLQKKGLDVAGIDISPLAIKVCKRRGLKKATVMTITQVTRKLGIFDTTVMYGNGFGLPGSPRSVRWWLKRMLRASTIGARIIAETLDPYDTKDPAHLAYHRRNRRRGRTGGQLRLRVRYRNFTTPYFDWVFVSRDEMRKIVAGTGWKIIRFFDSKGPSYIAVLEKEHSSLEKDKSS